MNCKPLELARVISDPETIMSGTADKIIQVTQLTTVGGIWPGWMYAGPSMHCICGCGCEIDAFADVLLRPIRGQEGDDETLTWAGLPTPAETPVTA